MARLRHLTLLAQIFLLYSTYAHNLNGNSLHSRQHDRRPSNAGHPPCGNSAQNRAAWCDGYDINTDYESVVPTTGRTREYWLTVGDYMLAPDGYSRPVMAVNGTIPGPTLFADWGDWVVIHVYNNMTNSQNGTSMHWHGIRQHNTNQYDGVPSITQCPIAPKTSMTYRWRATQYGTAWYHSHIGLQAWDGVFGGIIINGPATANYDEDKGVVMLSDWDHQTMASLYTTMQSSGTQALGTALINGTMVAEHDSMNYGQYFSLGVKQGSSYRLRLVNAAINEGFLFTIDGHDFTVIAMDLVPINPFVTANITIAMGQRYDIIVNANQRANGNSFWIRSIPLSSCQANDNARNIRGFLYYDTKSVPTESQYTHFDDNCDDPPRSLLVPHLAKSVGDGLPVYSTYENISVHLARKPSANNFYRWFLDGTSIRTSWDNPSLKQIYTMNEDFTKSNAVVELRQPRNSWVYLLIETPVGIYHPIHLHGHEFYILSQGSGHWDPAGTLHDARTLYNPPRRDTAMLPQNGHLLLAWKIDNPGVWLMHCHIGWHILEGFALQFVELRSEIPKIVHPEALEPVCDRWMGEMPWDDSGV